MLGRKDYTQEELQHGQTVITQQLQSYRALAGAMPASTGDSQLGAAREAFDAQFFNNLTLLLDRLYVHRLSGKAYKGKDGNPLNELRLITDSLLSHEGRLRSDKQITLRPESSVLGLAVGDEIRLTEADFERLAAAFFAALRARFVR